ncbi:Uncharacterised protein [Mycobacteroides abscessus]|nr:Uncharacterised protein [Mycobacteroides abscessus]
MRDDELKIDSAIRSPSKLSTSSWKTLSTAPSYSIIEPDTSRHSTMSRVPRRSTTTSVSTGRAATAPAPTTATSSPAAVRPCSTR